MARRPDRAEGQPIDARSSLCTDVAALLAQRLGFDAETLGPAFLAGVVSRAVRESAAADEQSWWRDVVQGGRPWQQLVDLAVVNETWMFRDAGAYESLARFALQRRARPGAHVLRVLSCPCSTGEEPYSVAITLLEAGLRSGEFIIDAVDVSARALSRAAQGRLGRHAFRGDASPPAGYLEHDAVAAEWVVLPHVRDSVRFQVGNLVSGEGLPGGDGFDLVLCRNLLMYLLPEARAAALQRFAALLAPGGLLVVGHAEAGIAAKAGFTPRGRPESFAFDAPGAAPAPRIPQPAAAVAPAWRRAQDVGQSAAPAQAVPASPRTGAAAPPPRPTLQQIRARADAGDIVAALRDCQRHLAQSPQSVSGHLLLAALHAASGDFAAAEASLRRVLYLEPDSVEALTHLAAIRADRGDAAAALRLRSRAERVLAEREAAPP